jgi:hypothetical protein
MDNAPDLTCKEIAMEAEEDEQDTGSDPLLMDTGSDPLLMEAEHTQTPLNVQVFDEIPDTPERQPTQNPIPIASPGEAQISPIKETAYPTPDEWMYLTPNRDYMDGEEYPMYTDEPNAMGYSPNTLFGPNPLEEDEEGLRYDDETRVVIDLTVKHPVIMPAKPPLQPLSPTLVENIRTEAKEMFKDEFARTDYINERIFRHRIERGDLIKPQNLFTTPQQGESKKEKPMSLPAQCNIRQRLMLKRRLKEEEEAAKATKAANDKKDKDPDEKNTEQDRDV